MLQEVVGLLPGRHDSGSNRRETNDTPCNCDCETHAARCRFLEDDQSGRFDDAVTDVKYPSRNIEIELPSKGRQWTLACT